MEGAFEIEHDPEDARRTSMRVPCTEDRSTSSIAPLTIYSKKTQSAVVLGSVIEEAVGSLLHRSPARTTFLCTQMSFVCESAY